MNYLIFFRSLIPMLLLISCSQDGEMAFAHPYLAQNRQDTTASAYNNYGAASWERDEYQKALEYLSKGYGLSKKTNDKKMMSHVLNNMGLVHWSLEDYKSALECYEQAGKLAKTLQLNEVYGLTFMNRSLILKEYKNYHKAHIYNDSALIILKKVGIPEHIGKVYNNKGQIYKMQGYLDSARHCYEKAIEIYRPVNFRDGMAASYFNIADITKEKNEKEALTAAYTSLKLALADKSEVRMNEAYFKLSDIYGYYHKPDSALKYNKLYAEVKINFLTNSHSEKLAHHQAVMAAEVKNLKLENLEQQNIIATGRIWLYGVAIMLILLLICFLFYQKLTRETHKKKQLEFELAGSRQLISVQEKELRSYILNLAKKNMMLSGLQNKISEKKSSEEQDIQIAELLGQKILTEEDWKHFKTKFNVIYPLFFSRIKQFNITLTEAEARFLVLYKLKLKGKEMAATLGISLQSVRACKMRLRKKLAVSGYQSVEDFISRI